MALTKEDQEELDKAGGVSTAASNGSTGAVGSSSSNGLSASGSANASGNTSGSSTSSTSTTGDKNSTASTSSSSSSSNGLSASGSANAGGQSSGSSSSSATDTQNASNSVYSSSAGSGSGAASGSGEASSGASASSGKSSASSDEGSVVDLYNALNAQRTSDPAGSDASLSSWDQYNAWLAEQEAASAEAAAAPVAGLTTRTVQTVPVDAQGNPIISTVSGNDPTKVSDSTGTDSSWAQYDDWLASQGLDTSAGTKVTTADGSTWVKNADGTYSDVSLTGGTTPTTNRDGSTTTANADGTATKTYPDGTIVKLNADGTVLETYTPPGTASDETQLVAEADLSAYTDPKVVAAANGIEAATATTDQWGASVWTDPNDGSTWTTFADGTVEIREADGTTKTYKAGGTPLDPIPAEPTETLPPTVDEAYPARAPDETTVTDEQAAADKAWVEANSDGTAGKTLPETNSDPTAWGTVKSNATAALNDLLGSDWWTQVSTTAGYKDPNSGSAKGADGTSSSYTPGGAKVVPTDFVDLNKNGVDDRLEVPTDDGTGSGGGSTNTNPVAVFPTSAYRPGIDPEWDYYPAMKNGGIVKYAEGGIAGAMPGGAPAPAAPAGVAAVNPMSGQDPRIETIAAAEQVLARIKPGQMPPEQDVATLKAFVDKFGQEALQKLQGQVKQGKFMKGAPQQAAGPEGGIAGAAPPRMIQGAGGPTSDSIPARINNVQEAALSNGEFVIPANVVAKIGKGDPRVGAQRLQELSERLSGKPVSSAVNVEQVG